jgi:hypothetical protein
MSDGFIDFSLGTGDEDVGKKSSRFQAKDDTTYRMSFLWFSVALDDKDEEIKPGDTTTKLARWDDSLAFNKEGDLTANAQIRFTGCERIYKKGVGYFLYKGPAYAQFGKPRQSVSTAILVWPTNSEGELDVAQFKAGKGWSVMPWIFSPDKYKDIKAKHKRFSLMKHDLSAACPENGAEYQKLSFTPEGESLLKKLMASEKAEYQAVVAKIFADAKGVISNIHSEMARDLTVDEIREKMGEDVGSAAGGSSGHAAKDVEELLDDVL